MAAWRFRFSKMVRLGSLGAFETLGVRRKGGADRVPRFRVPNLAEETACWASATVLTCGMTTEAPASSAKPMAA